MQALAEDFQRARRSLAADAQRLEDARLAVENARLALRRTEEDFEEKTKSLAEKREAGMRAYRVYKTMKAQEEEAEMSKFLQFLSL